MTASNTTSKTDDDKQERRNAILVAASAVGDVHSPNAVGLQQQPPSDAVIEVGDSRPAAFPPQLLFFPALPFDLEDDEVIPFDTDDDGAADDDSVIVLAQELVEAIQNLRRRQSEIQEHFEGNQETSNGSN